MDHDKTAREIAMVLKGDAEPNCRDQFAKNCQSLVLDALREADQAATGRAAKIARFIGDNTQKDPMMKNLANIIADAIESREMLELNVAVAEILRSKTP